MTAATEFRLPIANIDGWIVNAVADPVRSAGGQPVPRAELERMADLRVGPTATTDGYIVADANGLPHEEGQHAIITQVLRILRGKRWIAGDDEALAWSGPADGDLSLTVNNRIVILRAERSRKQGTYRHELGLLSRGQSDPYKVTAVGPGGGEQERRLAMHPLADLIPAMADSDLERFLADVKANGIREPVRLFEGKVLDGKHRLWAAKRLGVPLPWRQFDGDADAAHSYVFSANIYRRHLTGAQIVLLAEKAGIIAQAQAEAKAAQIRKPMEDLSGSIEPNKTDNGSAPAPSPKPGPRWEQRASDKIGGLASPASLRRFNDAKITDAPETVAKIESGEIKSVAGAVSSAERERGETPSNPVSLGVVQHLSNARYNMSRALGELDGKTGPSRDKALSYLAEIRQLADQIEDAMRPEDSTATATNRKD